MIKWWLAAVVLVALTTGCASQEDMDPPIDRGPYGPTDAQLSPAQLSALADEVVTREEYDAGFERYKKCLAAAGFPLTDDGIVNGEHEYWVPAAAEDAGVEPGCYIREYTVVDFTWQAHGALGT